MARPRKFAEADVLAAATDRFRASGYEATSIDDLTAATGLSRSSLYGAFGDKHALYLRVFGDYCARAMADAEASLRGPDDTAMVRLRAYVRAATRDAPAAINPRGCFLARGTSELAGDDAEVTDEALATFRALHRELTACVAAAQRNGDVGAAADPAAVAGALLAAMRGIESLGRAGMTTAELTPIAEAALAAVESA
jgi:AcrR family transcriptional regulator